MILLLEVWWLGIVLVLLKVCRGIVVLWVDLKY